MEKLKDVHEYKEAKTPRGAMKIEVVMEPQKKPKKDRPASASSIRNIDDIQKRQKAAEERRKQMEMDQLTTLAEKQKKAAEVRAKKATLPPMTEGQC